jgi:hypothetical protein
MNNQTIPATIAIGLERKEITENDANRLLLEHFQKVLNECFIRLDQMKEDQQDIRALDSVRREIVRISHRVIHYKRLAEGLAA